MPRQITRGLAISNFNISNFVGYLSNDSEQPKIDISEAPFDQVIQVLADSNHLCWQHPPDFVVIWTRPNGLIRSFDGLLHGEPATIEQILLEVEDYASLIIGAKKRARFIFVPSWTIPPYEVGASWASMRPGGVGHVLARMNEKLAECLESCADIHMLDTNMWVAQVGRAAFNPKFWYMSKVAFGPEVFKMAMQDVKSALRGLTGGGKKVIVLDLDDTLWGGIVGDIGWENLKMGGHDPISEAYVDFQRGLKVLSKRGVLLSIVSKNEESVALEAFHNHPEMVLKTSDFAGWRINWVDKAKNVADLAQELNLGLDSMVFIDDNPVERARVMDALPSVLVPEWPSDPMLYHKALLSLACFDVTSVSQEDLKRTEMYRAERERTSLRDQMVSVEDWLGTLGIQVKVEEVTETNLPRVTQLFNKTNQMNLSTRRMTESELVSWAQQYEHKMLAFRVSDKFGDAGLTGIVGIVDEGQHGKIIDFILSCRVMGRNIEETMVYTVLKYAKSKGWQEVYAQYIPTPKNKPCLNFWMTSEFTRNAVDDSFHWTVDKDYRLPPHVEVSGVLYD